MTNCTNCQKKILFGGFKAGADRYCGEKCADAALLPKLTEAFEAAQVSVAAIPLPRSGRTGPQDSDLVDREGAKPGLVIAVGVAVAVALSFALHHAEMSVGRELRGINMWIILPLGAALNGAVISVGFFAAARLLNSRPRFVTYASAVVTAGAMFWLTYALLYLSLATLDGTPVREQVGFTAFVRDIVEQTEVTIGRGRNATVRTGGWSYALYAADLVGFMLGAAAVVYFAGNKPYCARCGSFMRRLGSIRRSTGDMAAAGAALRAVHANLEANNPQGAVDAFAALGAADSKNYLGIELACHGCAGCGDYTARTKVTAAGAKGPREVEGLGADFSGNGAVRFG